eukprot:3345492-Pyramimonas_sp.AAC.1
MENTFAYDSAGCPAGSVMKVSSSSSLSVSGSRGTSSSQSSLPSSITLGILRGKVSVGQSGIEGSTRLRSIEGAERRSSSMIATGLERG